MASDMGDNLFSKTNRDLARKYWIIIGVIIAFLTFLNILDRILTRLRLRAAASNHPNPTKVTSFFGQLYATSTALARETALPSIPSFTGKDTVWALLTPPPLGRSLIVFAYMIVIAIFLSFNVYVSGYWYYEKIAYRAAWISITQIPFVLLIGGRLSLFTLLTSIPSERINWLHRWVGRVILVSVLVHMSLFWREWDLIDFLQTELEIMPMVRYGFGGFGVLAWITITSIAPVRWFAYEIFYINHLASIGALLWCLYMHVPTSAIYNVWLGIGFLAFDRVLRGALFLYNNIHRSSSAQGKFNLKFGHAAEVEILDRKEHLTRVVIKDVKMKWRAGQHIYLNIPSLRPFEAHPFTISNIYESIPRDTSGEYRELGKKTATKERRDLQLLIRSRAGFSKSLHKKCSPAAQAPVVLKAFVDGPYGNPPVWNSFETVVLIATSTGITFVLPILEELASDPACIRRIHFYWTVRHVSDLKLLTKKLATLAAKARSRGVDINLNVCVTCGTMKEARDSGKFVVGGSTVSEISSSEDEKGSGEILFKKSGEKRIETVDEITPVNLPDIASPSCCSNKPPAPKASPTKDEQQDISSSHRRSTSTSSSDSSSSSSSSEAPGCCCSSSKADGNACCETICTCGFSSDDINFTCGRPTLQKMILPPIEQAVGETIVACCANRRLMDDVRNYVGKVCDDRAVHKGSGAQGILCWTEGFY